MPPDDAARSGYDRVLQAIEQSSTASYLFSRYGRATREIAMAARCTQQAATDMNEGRERALLLWFRAVHSGGVLQPQLFRNVNTSPPHNITEMGVYCTREHQSD